MAEGTTAMGRTRMHGMVLRATAWMTTNGQRTCPTQGSFGATGRVRRKPSSYRGLRILLRRAGVRRRPLSETMRVRARGQGARSAPLSVIGFQFSAFLGTQKLPEAGR
jgi:hypothetical protein